MRILLLLLPISLLLSSACREGYDFYEFSCEIDAQCSDQYICVEGNCKQRDTSSVCGDLVVSGDEHCEDGNNITEICAYGETCVVCNAYCRRVPGPTSYCGDGSIQPDVEQCDDGNTDDCDGGCSADCSTNITGCGDGFTCGTETCDDGNTTTETCAYDETSCTVCDATCQDVAGATSYCGDGTIDSTNSEMCDDGNTGNGSGDCLADCTPNTAPVVSVTAPEEAAFGQRFDIAVEISDENVDTVTLEVVADDTTLFPAGSFVIPDTVNAIRTIEATSAVGVVGVSTLTITATDHAGETGTATTDIDIYVHRTATGVVFTGSDDKDINYSVGADDAGNIYACGTAGEPIDSYDWTAVVAAAMKFDRSGAITWIEGIGATNGNIGRRCSVLPTGELAFATQLKPNLPNVNNEQETGLYTWDADGNADLERVYLANSDGSGTDSYGINAVIAEDGSVYELSWTNANTVTLYKFSSDGNEDWSRIAASGGESIRATFVALSPTGEIWVLGYGDGTLVASDLSDHVAAAYDSFIATYDADGDLLNFGLIGGSGDDTISKVVFADGGIYIVGSTQSVLDTALTALNGTRDWFVQKRSDSTTVVWTKQGGKEDSTSAGKGIAVGHDGTIYLSGSTDYVDSSNSNMHITALNGETGALIYHQVYGQAGSFTTSTDLVYSGRDLIATGSSNAQLGSPSTPSLGGDDAFILFLNPVDGTIRVEGE